MIEYVLPDISLIERLLRARLGDFDTEGLGWSAVARSAVDLSHAEVIRAAEDAAKAAVLAGGRRVTAEALGAAIEERRRASIGT